MAIRHLPYTVLMAVITLLPAGVFLSKVSAYSPWPSCFCACLDLHWRHLSTDISGKDFDNYIPADADTQDTDLQNGNSAETSSAENDHTV